MTKIEIAKMLGELKPKVDELGKFLIDESCEIINRLPEKSLKKSVEIIGLIDNYLCRGSRIENANSYLENLYAELKKQLLEAQKHIKDEALSSMRENKKKRAIRTIVFLSIVTGVVLALGILSALEFIPAVWCNVIGVFDCAFGLIFFIYEYCDDKLNEANINAGNAETIKKYHKESGDISFTGDGSVNITGGKVKGNIIVNRDIDELFK